MSAVLTEPQASAMSLLRRINFLAGLTIVLVVVTTLIEPRFLTAGNLTNVLRNASFLMLVSTGQMFVIVCGGFDLSVGAVVALSSVVGALTMSSLDAVSPDSAGVSIAAGVAAALAVGGVVGLLNGLCVQVLRASAFMVTLGAMSIATGLAFYLTAGTPIYGLPESFSHGFGRLSLLTLPLPFWIAAAVVGLVWFIQQQTATGRYLYAIGGNAAAARMTGIRVLPYVLGTYVASSVLAAGTGLLLTSRLGSGQATLGSDLMLQSIAACMLARVRLSGGVGRVENVAVGVLFLSILSNSMNLVRIDSKAQTIVIGLIIIVAVALEQIRQKGE